MRYKGSGKMDIHKADFIVYTPRKRLFTPIAFILIFQTFDDAIYPKASSPLLILFIILLFDFYNFVCE